MPNPFRAQLTRRHVLQLAAAGAVAATLPVRRLAVAGTGEPLTLFLTSAELAVVDAATARLFPSDTTVGAHECGVVNYIQGLLSGLPAADANCDGERGAADFAAITVAIGAGQSTCAAADVNGDGQFDDADLSSATLALFEARPLFGGGPFSGRNPFLDAATHTPSDRFPADAFGRFVAPNRVTEIAWRVRLDGPTAAPALAEANPLLSESSPNAVSIDFRRRYRQGIATIEGLSHTEFSKPFVTVGSDRQDRILAKPAATAFVGLLTVHMIEGLFSAPEYGGNHSGLGWQLVGYDGDSQPLGYTFGFDEAQGQYVDRPDRPNTAPNLGEPCSGFSSDMEKFLRALVGAQENFQEFESPECIGVSA